jgi:hypothetical protein
MLGAAGDATAENVNAAVSATGRQRRTADILRLAVTSVLFLRSSQRKKVTIFS